MSEQESKPNIQQRIQSVMGAVSYVQKDGNVKIKTKNGEFSYKAVTHDAVTNAVREHLIDHGIVMQSSVANEPVMNNDKICTVVVDVDFVNVDSPEDRISGRWPSFAMDYGDKAIGKGISMAVKYAILKTFCLETGEDEESRLQGAKAEPIQAKELKVMTDLLEETDSRAEDFVAWINKERSTNYGTLYDMMTNDYPFAISFLNLKLKKLKEAEAKKEDQVNKPPAKKPAAKKPAGDKP